MNAATALQAISEAVKSQTIEVVQSVQWSSLKQAIGWIVDQLNKESTSRQALEVRVAGMEARRDAYASKQEMLALAGRIGLLESKLVKLDERQEAQQETLDKLQEALTSVEETVSRHHEEFMQKENELSERCATLDEQYNQLRAQLLSQASGRLDPLEKKLGEQEVFTSELATLLEALKNDVESPPSGSFMDGIHQRVQTLEEERKLFTPMPTITGVTPDETTKDAIDNALDASGKTLSKRMHDCEWLVDTLQEEGIMPI